MRIRCQSDVKTRLLSGLLTFLLVGCTQFPDTFDLAAKKAAPAVNGAQAIATPDVAPDGAN